MVAASAGALAPCLCIVLVAWLTPAFLPQSIGPWRPYLFLSESLARLQSTPRDPAAPLQQEDSGTLLNTHYPKPSLAANRPSRVARVEGLVDAVSQIGDIGLFDLNPVIDGMSRNGNLVPLRAIWPQPAHSQRFLQTRCSSSGHVGIAFAIGFFHEPVAAQKVTHCERAATWWPGACL
jgi:hypothetical protein